MSVVGREMAPANLGSIAISSVTDEETDQDEQKRDALIADLRHSPQISGDFPCTAPVRKSKRVYSKYYEREGFLIEVVHVYPM